MKAPKVIRACLALAGAMCCSSPAQAQTAPVISGISPDGTHQFQASPTLSFTASSPTGVSISPGSISVQLTVTTLAGYSFQTNLTGTAGLTVTGAPTSHSVSALLTSNLVYTAAIQVTDANGQSGNSTVSFDTIVPAYTFEAEDYDYNSGRFFDNPAADAYAGLNATDEIDAHNTSGGNNAYRPNPSGLATEDVGDTPRLAYLGTGKQDYDVGWNDGGSGNFGNYTRTFPGGAYNIYMRGSNPNTTTEDSASMGVVIGGQGTSSQTVSNLGTFSVPDTGNWQVYTWVPLLDTNGNLAKFTGGAVKTLRISTDNGNYNANFYLLMPADTNEPVIANLYPNGSNFFQFTNSLNFSASCAAGITTNSIDVILDGTPAAGLVFSGSATNWNVSCPLSVSTNHTVAITVTANNGNAASETVTFNDFQATNYTWEAEDYDYGGGKFFDNPQVDAYANLASVAGVDNFQSDHNANPFDYRPNSPAPSTTPAGDQQRNQFAGKSDYNIGYFGGGSWVNYTRHYPAGTYTVWGRFAEGSTASEAVLSQLASGYGTANQTSNVLGTFSMPDSGGWQTWEWAPLMDSNGNLLKVRFDGSQYTLQLAGSPVAGQAEVNVNFLMLAATTPDLFTTVKTFNIGTTNVQILYSKPVEAASAANPANYVFTNGLAVTGAILSADEVTVTLTTAPLVFGSNYSIVINGVRDRMNVPNTIAANTMASFQALPFALQDIGNPAVDSTAVIAGNGINITSAGSNFDGIADQGDFSYQTYSGNFDVCVRVAGLALSDDFAKAGLMARESLAAGGRFAASIATPAMNGTYFEWRDPANSASSTTGNFPANYPNTWLRLNRVGNVFTGFGSYDGLTWTQLGSETITMSNQVYLGFSVSSDSTNVTTTAQFRDFSNVTNAVVGTVVDPHEAIGASSRTTPIVFSEIMWKPAPRTDHKNLEFFEIYNSNPWFQDISGYQVTCTDVSYTFPANTTIAGGAYLVVAAAPADIQSVYGITNVFGPYTGSLKHSETLEMIDEHGAVLLTAPYDDVYPWPVATDGTGHSLVLANPTYGEGDPRAWDISDTTGGSPGQMDSFTPSPLRNVVINEILPHSENPAVPQFVELYNHSTNSVNVSGCILTDDPTTNKFVIPAGTMIGPAGFIAFTQAQFGFTLNGAGETLYFIKPDGSRVLDAVQFGAQADGVSFGRSPDGANDFYNFTSRTPGTNNSAILIGNIVINELMYDPISGNDDDQYIELYNQGANAVNLAGWQFTTGVTFTFPTNAVIGPKGYVVVGRNTANLFANYPNLNPGNTYGNYSGKLSHNGELLTLAMPQTLNVTNAILVEEDEVTYGTGGRWGQWSGGGGSSLELIDPHSNHRLAANWADSDETYKSVWTNIETTGVLDNGANYDASIDYAQIGTLDSGECLVDDIEVDDTNGVNYVSNPTFESGTNDWTFQGCMTRSSLENSGYESNHSLHIRSSDRIWTGDNSCQVSLNNTSLQPGQTATLRFKARWLHGWPEALLRLNGNWLEAAGALPVPTNLGSPGMPNSQYITNAGPAMYSVTHTPSLPAANQPVVVTANVNDPDGVQNLTLFYRLDPATTYTAVPMKDNGTGGDAVAGDGVYSATIPGQAANQIVAFYISATDGLGASTRFPALLLNNSPTQECLVMFGDGNPGGSFGVYHFWISQTNVTRWANLSDLSNEKNDGTFVTGKRVIYNVLGRFAGSPYHQDFDTPVGNLCHYEWTFRDDDQFLGTTDFNKIHQPGNFAGDDASLQREQLANTFLRTLGIPWLNRRYVAVYVNGNRRGALMEDAQCPGTDIVKEQFPNDTDGFLYKMQPWFEFAPFPSGSTIGFDNQSWCNFDSYTTTGGVNKVARYRYMFLMRRTPDSASDFTNVFSVIDAANSSASPNYVANMENMANMENWMRMFAANHAAGNWDAIGGSTGQNVYGYIGTQGTKYSMLMWDFNLVMGNVQAWLPGQNLFTLNGEDPNMANIFNNPTFRRMYWRALQELVNGPLDPANSGPLMAAKYNTFVANGLSVEDPAANIEPWISEAKSSIAAQLAAVNAPGFTVNPAVTVSNNVAYVTGAAPVNVAVIWINGVAYPLTWTSLTTWDIALPLVNGTNIFNVVGLDHNGQPITGTSNSVSVVYNGTNPSPVGQVVINEIMYDPLAPEGQFVELFNTSGTATFDLSGWQLEGLNYTFPPGSALGPDSFLVLAANNNIFAADYGATNAVFDYFSGTLQAGQNLTLLQSGSNGSSNIVVAEVQYESVLPWPTNAIGTSSSLQLIDPHQDNWRVGNWAVRNSPGQSFSPDAANTVAATLPPFPTLWLNEVEPNNLTGLTNSAGQHAAWLELYNPGSNSIPLTGLYLANNYTNLLQWPFPSGATINAGQFKIIFADGQANLSTLNELHTSFVLPAATGSLALSRAYKSQPQVLDYLDYVNLLPDYSYGSFPDGQSFVRQEFINPTPGAANVGSSVPPPSLIPYETPGSTYTQNFDALPDPGSNSVNTANPVTINGVTYSLGNPFDFAFPVLATGNGGLGLAELAGWYGLADPSASVGTRFGATDGDQTTGGQLSFGLPNSSNRSLGLLATSTTGFTAFGAKLVNGTSQTLKYMNLQYTGEVWRQSDTAKTLQFYYLIDPSATNVFSTAATANVPALNVNFPTVTADKGGVPVDGTAAANQINCSVTNQVINWPPGAALWLTWEMASPTGKAQGLGIDNLSFSAMAQPSGPAPALGAGVLSGGRLTLSWPTIVGPTYQIEASTNLSGDIWTPVGAAFSGTGASVSETNTIQSSGQTYFRLKIVP